jgi:hypothetical protein
MQPNQCLNCKAVLENNQQFCNRCGQKADTHRLHFHDLWHDVVHYFTHADKGIFHLVRELARRPGVVAREYIEGRRKTYFKPLNFYLIVAGILVFMTGYFHVVENSRVQQIRTAATHMTDPDRKKFYQDMAVRVERTNHFVSKYSNVINMLATPLMTLFFWLAYKKGRYNYVEHLVANLYFVPFVMLIYALLIVPLQKVVSGSSAGMYVLLGVFFLFEIIYRGIAYYQLMNRKGAWPWIKAMGISLLTVVLWVSGMMVLISTYIRKGF